MVPETPIHPRHCRGGSPQPPRYPSYAVVNARSGQVVSLHATRVQANSSKLDYAHRVRGSYEVLS